MPLDTLYSFNPEGYREQTKDIVTVETVACNEALIDALQRAAQVVYDYAYQRDFVASSPANPYPAALSYRGFTTSFPFIIKPYATLTPADVAFFSADDLSRLANTKKFFLRNKRLPENGGMYYTSAQLVQRFFHFINDTPGGGPGTMTEIDPYWLYHFVAVVPQPVIPSRADKSLQLHDVTPAVVNSAVNAFTTIFNTSKATAVTIMKSNEAATGFKWWVAPFKSHSLLQNATDADLPSKMLRFFEPWVISLEANATQALTNLKTYITSQTDVSGKATLVTLGFPFADVVAAASAVAFVNTLMGTEPYDDVENLESIRKLLRQLFDYVASFSYARDTAIEAMTTRAFIYTNASPSIDTFSQEKILKEASVQVLAREMGQNLIKMAQTSDLTGVRTVIANVLGVQDATKLTPEQTVIAGKTGKVPTPDSNGNVTVNANKTGLGQPAQNLYGDAVIPVLSGAASQLASNPLTLSFLAQASTNAFNYIAQGASGNKLDLQSESAKLAKEHNDRVMSAYGTYMTGWAAGTISNVGTSLLDVQLKNMGDDFTKGLQALGLPPAVVEAAGGLNRFVGNELVGPYLKGATNEFVRQSFNVLTGQKTLGEAFGIGSPVARALFGPFSFLNPPTANVFKNQKDNIFINALSSKQPKLFNEVSAGYGRSIGKPRVYLEFYGNGPVDVSANPHLRLEFLPLPGTNKDGENPFGLPGIVMKTKMNDAVIPIVGGTPVVQSLGIASDTIELSGILIPYKARPDKEQFLYGTGETPSVHKAVINAGKGATKQEQEIIWSGSPVEDVISQKGS